LGFYLKINDAFFFEDYFFGFSLNGTVMIINNKYQNLKFDRGGWGLFGSVDHIIGSLLFNIKYLF